MNATEPQTLEQMAEGLLIPEEPEAEAPDEDQTDAEDVTDEDEAEAEPDSDEDPDEAEADEGEEDDDDEDDEAEVSEQPQKFKVKVDGREQEVTLEELTRGYAGQSYIQKGMKEAADLRKQAEENYNALSQQRQQLQNLVQTLQTDGLRPPSPPDKSMLHSDPIGYMEAKEAFESERAEYDQRVQSIQQQQAQAQAAERQAMQAFLQDQQKILAQTIPEFADPEKGTALQKKLRATGMEYGFAEQDLAGITDARHVQVLHDAMRYRELIAKKGQVAAKAEKARPVVKSGAKKAQAPAKLKREKQRQKLRQTGRAEDAIDLMFDT